MKRTAIAAFAWAFLATVNLAAPHRLRLEQPKPPAPTLDLRGTTWTGYNEGVKVRWVVFFDPSGIFEYRYGNSTFRNGTWKQDGNRIYYESNQKYCECTSVVTGNTIIGESWNVTGLRWQILLTRSK